MKNAIIIGLIVVFAVGFLLWRRSGSSDPSKITALSTGTTAASFTETIPTYNFGSISMAKGNVEHEFIITNTAEADFTITRAETSCMCTKAILKLPDDKEIGPFGMPGHGGFSPAISAIVRPNEKLIIRTIFDPAAHGPAGIGEIERSVTLTTNKGLVVMQFSANVTP